MFWRWQPSTGIFLIARLQAEQVAAAIVKGKQGPTDFGTVLSTVLR